jgi:hypothetical protein
VVIFVNYVREWRFFFTRFVFYLCIEYQTYQLSFNLTYIPDYQNLSSNASQQLQSLINQTLTVALINVTSGGFRPDLISIT